MKIAGLLSGESLMSLKLTTPHENSSFQRSISPEHTLSSTSTRLLRRQRQARKKDISLQAIKHDTFGKFSENFRKIFVL
jgi:hypothetical protein